MHKDPPKLEGKCEKKAALRHKCNSTSAMAVCSSHTAKSLHTAQQPAAPAATFTEQDL